MLQLRDLDRRARLAYDAESALGPAWRTPEELAATANDAVARLRTLRDRLAATPLERLVCWLDHRVRTDATEYLDLPDYPEAKKLAQVRFLHLQNRATGSYARYLSELEPLVTASAARRADGRARVLELASGYGELALELAELAAERGAPVTITGSDVVASYVADGNRRARERNLDARFRLLDAFELGGVEPGEIDVAFIAQSTHHFDPGQLARMIQRVETIGARHFVSFDGERSLRLVAALPLMAAVALDRGHVHDAFVSARRMYAESELVLIAELAAPRARVTARRRWPGVTVLQIDYA